LKSQWGHLAPRTILDYSYYILQLAETFSEICDDRQFDYKKLLIDDIDDQWMHAYQEKRQAGPGLINKELGVIARTRYAMLSPDQQHAGKNPIPGYRRLKMPKEWEGPGRKLGEKEKQIWEKTCIEYADHKRWGVAALTSLLQLHSGLGPGEIRNARLRDVTIAKKCALYVSPAGAKRRRRQRLVECTDYAEWALRKLWDRAHKLGCCEPHHFLLPGIKSRKDKRYDPEKMCDSWKNGFRALLGIAQTKFRNYDQRHDAISVALQDPRVTLTGASQHFGHISEVMQRRYYHGSREVSRVVAQAISDGGGKKKLKYEQEYEQQEVEKKPRKKPAQKVNGNATKYSPQSWSITSSTSF
jgi:integrase